MLQNTTRSDLVTHNVPPITPVPPEALSVTKHNRQRQEETVCKVIETFTDLHLSPVLVKASPSVQVGPSHMHPDPAEAATNCGTLVAPNRLPRASHRQCVTFVCTTVPLKRLQNQNTQWPITNNIRTGSSELHRWHIQREMPAHTRTH